jgi:hypothetical protein
MGGNKIERSQQESQGIAVGQSNDDVTMPVGAKGPHDNKQTQEPRQIPNQDRSSETNEQQSEKTKKD